MGDADSDGEGGDGISFCYGALPSAAFGEMGVVEGLCVRLRTAAHLVMEVSCNGSVLASRSMAEGTFAQRSGSPLRSGAYLPLDVSRVRGDGVRVLLDADGGEDELAMLHVPEEVLAPLYAPGVTWRFGVGARSGDTPAAHQVP